MVADRFAVLRHAAHTPLKKFIIGRGNPASDATNPKH